VAPYTNLLTASTNIQAALNVSSTSTTDVVVVLPGVYTESLNFNGKPAWLVGAQGPARTVLNAPTGSAAISFGSGEGSNSLVTSFTITNGGIGVSSSSPTIVSNWLLNCGTAINAYFASPNVIGNVINGGNGNAVYLQGADTALIE